ncbi:MAG: hemerythrin domain-containing protein [Nocardioidaceae bacterium]
MGSVQIISFERDKAAASAMERRHAAMRDALTAQVEDLVTAVASGGAEAAEAVRRELWDWCRSDLLPHAWAEEKAMYPVAYADPRATLLVEGMLAEHEVISGLVDQVGAAEEPVRAAAAANALAHVFSSHLAKENEQLLPLLTRSPHVSLADLLDGMHDLVGVARREREQDLVSR